MNSAIYEDVTMEESFATQSGFLGARTDLICPECGQPMTLGQSKYGLFYGCLRYPDCRATLSAHPDSSPRGVPGDKATRLARIRAHRVFDRLWTTDGVRPPLLSRREAYAWLQIEMGLLNKQGIGHLDAAGCERLIQAVQKRYPEIHTVWERLLREDAF